MDVNGKHYRTIWLTDDDKVVQIIDQRWLPHRFVVEDIRTVEDMAVAIKDMHLRGAPLIGASAAYGMYLAALNYPVEDANDIDEYLDKTAKMLKGTRPTAVNLAWAVDRSIKEIHLAKNSKEKIRIALKVARDVEEEEYEFCRKIGEFGLSVIEDISRKKKGETVNILTHCNAGWLACIDFGTATAPIYAAFKKGIKVHVWVDETRPRNQGAQLTAWELGQQGVPHTVIADNVGGHLMQHGMVDMDIVGTDRTSYTGDVANKIGTYLKALAAKDNNVPFYVALTSSAFDWNMRDGLKEIPIETRDSEEVRFVQGLHEGTIKKVLITPHSSPAANYGFDVTPARLVTGLITERGICPATEKGIMSLYPERNKGE